jgi:hypothetical protein
MKRKGKERKGLDETRVAITSPIPLRSSATLQSLHRKKDLSQTAPNNDLSPRL